MGNFNVESDNTNMEESCNQYEPTCFKNVGKPSCVDLFLTNSWKRFEDSLILETGLWDFHKLIVTVIKTKHERFPPTIVNYRDYKTFDAKVYKNRLELTLKKITSFEEPQETFMDLLSKVVLLKCKYLRANHSISSTAIMPRTRFRHQFLKIKTSEAKAKYNK